jgi:hypothetical protein
MCGQIAPQSPVEIFVQKKTHLGRGQSVLSRFFQESDDLLALYAREPVEKLLDRIARFQVIEKTLHRDASSGKNRLPAKNFRVLRYEPRPARPQGSQFPRTSWIVQLLLCVWLFAACGSDIRRGCRRKAVQRRGSRQQEYRMSLMVAKSMFFSGPGAAARAARQRQQ